MELPKALRIRVVAHVGMRPERELPVGAFDYYLLFAVGITVFRSIAILMPESLVNGQALIIAATIGQQVELRCLQRVTESPNLPTARVQCRSAKPDEASKYSAFSPPHNRPRCGTRWCLPKNLPRWLYRLEIWQ